jgi:hypothetical protein
MNTTESNSAKKAIRLEVEFDTNNAKRIRRTIGTPNTIPIFAYFIESLLKA